MIAGTGIPKGGGRRGGRGRQPLDRRGRHRRGELRVGRKHAFPGNPRLIWQGETTPRSRFGAVRRRPFVVER